MSEALNPHQIQELAGHLDGALRQALEVPPLTTRHPGLTLGEGYLIQDECIRLRLARGEKPVGLKMGFTSRAKREQMGLGSPIYGVLTDRMQVRAGSRDLSLKGSIHPKIEPEIAFIVAKELRGRIDARQALSACSAVFPALEILDSRFKGFKYFSLPDVVADNCSSSLFIVSDQKSKPGTPEALAGLRMSFSVNGKIVQSALSDEISGNPVNSLIQLCELLSERGLSVPAGSIVLAGAATQAVPLEPGMTVSLEVESLGTVSIGTQA